MQKIAILADSGSQILPNITDDQGIFIVPLQVTIDSVNYLDEIDIHALEVFQRMKEERCLATTSQPATGILVDTIQKIKKAGYEHVLAISLATGLSSTLEGMKLAADMENMPITLVDTKATAGNHRYLIKVAKTLIEEGKEVSEIQSILEELVADSATLIMVSDLQHLKRGGRITPAVALLGGLLKITPVMKLNEGLGGKIDEFDKVRTIKKANHRIVEYFKEKGVQSKDYILTLEHVLCENLANEMEIYMKEQLQSDKMTTGLLPSVVGVHMGIGGMGYQYIRKYKGIEQDA